MLLICFSVDAPESLENVEAKWLKEVRRYCPRVPVVLVANKSDLRTDPAIVSELATHKQTPVSLERGEEVSRRIGAHAYMECSAKLKDGVRAVFDTAVRAALQKRSKPKARNCTIL